MTQLNMVWRIFVKKQCSKAPNLPYLDSLAHEATARLSTPDSPITQESCHSTTGQTTKLQTADCQSSASCICCTLLRHQVEHKPTCNALSDDIDKEVRERQSPNGWQLQHAAES